MAHKAQNQQLIRWSIQEISGVATHLAKRCIELANVITWPL
jgi:hypothetical protein